MKLFVKLLIASLVIAVLLPFTLLKGKDGRPLMSLDAIKAPELSLPDMPDLPDADLGKVLPKDGGRQDIVYKWKDAKGEWHFSSTPPPQGTEYSVKGYDPNTNLIQSVKPKAEEIAPNKEPEPNPQVSVKAPGKIGNPYSPEKIENLFNDAKNVQNLLDERLKQQEALMGR
jgi:hypothetical protein